MYKKIGCYCDKKNFGNEVTVYEGDKNYLVIIKDREELAYYFIDNDFKKIYPMNSYMRQIDFDYNNMSQVIDCFAVDLSLYGYSKCPDYSKKIIKQLKNN